MQNDRFAWDDEKAHTNRFKHGVSFEVAALVFDDPHAQFEHDDGEWREERWRTIGLGAGRILLVISTERYGDIIRIISARPASRAEEDRYYRQALP